MIVETDLAPGERVDEKGLCKEFGISRTPLREALKVLASEGLVELLANRSPRIAPLTPESVADLFEMIGLARPASGRNRGPKGQGRRPAHAAAHPPQDAGPL